MFSRSQFSAMWFTRNRHSMQQMMESHFWSLTRYRIGHRFLGLDYAGNIILFSSYRKQTIGGWTAVTLGSPGTNNIFSADTNAANVLEDGYPMHYKASQRLQLFVTKERAKWQEAMKQKEQAAADKATDANSPEAVKSSPPEVNTDVYDSDQRFRDTLIIKCSHPKFFSHTLRLSPTKTLIYKACYFYLWLVVASFVLQGYLLFRSWVNPPARQGLIHLEEHALYLPKLLFAGVVMGVAWLVREAQPIIDPMVDALTAFFPQVNWGVVSADNLASRAETLAQETHPAAKERKKMEEEKRKRREQEIQRWWMRVLSVIVAILMLLCIL